MKTSTSREEVRAAAAEAGSDAVAAPRTTRVAARVIMLGVLLQAVFAGGFLSGRLPIAAHAGVGHMLPLLGLLVLVAGLVGRRKVREPMSTLAVRAALLLAIIVTVAAGTMAGGGARVLLMLHIPLAFAIMGLADTLVQASRRK